MAPEKENIYNAFRMTTIYGTNTKKGFRVLQKWLVRPMQYESIMIGATNYGAGHPV
jgi:hypothetical protein